jgi:hypothetical protein
MEERRRARQRPRPMSRMAAVGRLRPLASVILMCSAGVLGTVTAGQHAEPLRLHRCLSYESRTHHPASRVSEPASGASPAGDGGWVTRPRQSLRPAHRMNTQSRLACGWSAGAAAGLSEMNAASWLAVLACQPGLFQSMRPAVATGAHRVSRGGGRQGKADQRSNGTCHAPSPTLCSRRTTPRCLSPPLTHPSHQPAGAATGPENPLRWGSSEQSGKGVGISAAAGRSLALPHGGVSMPSARSMPLPSC